VKKGGRQIGCGLLMLIVGGIITAISYGTASGRNGTYVITIGLFVIGGITLLVGLYRWVNS
jgi:hypothetical protein